MKYNIPNRYLPAALLVLLVIGFIGYIDYKSDQNLFETEKMVQHSKEVINQSNKILLSGQYIETAALGFVITGDSSFLLQFAADEKELFIHIAKLRELTANNPGQQPLSDSLNVYVRRRLDYLFELIALRKSQKEFDPGIISASAGTGRHFINHIRYGINKIQQREEVFLSQRRKVNMRSETIFKIVSNSLYFFMAALAVLMLYVTGKYLVQTKDRNKKAEELRLANRQLVENINRRKTTEQEMKWLINNTEECFLLLDRHFNIISFNKCAHQQYLKYLSGNLVRGNYFLEHAKPQRRLKTLEIYKKVLSGSEEKNEIRIGLDSNPEKVFELKYKPAENEAGDIIGIFISAVDITEQKLAEKRIKESGVRYRSLIEQATDAICIADASLKFIDINPYACAVLGYTTEEALQLTVPDVIFAEDLAENPFRFDEIKSEEIIRNERRLKRKDGTGIVMEVSTRMMSDGLFILFGHDISERKAGEIRLKQMNENIHRHARELAVSNAELEQFAYVASHDLQEPLRMVTSFLTMLEKKYGNTIDEKGKQYIAFAVDGAKRMKHIIFDLLDFSRVGSVKEKKERVDLEELVREIQQLFQKDIAGEGAIITSENLPVIIAYKSPLFRVFQNLVGNALKYRQKEIAPRISISAKESADHWQLSVRDNGIGVEAEYFDKIFVIFQRLHNRDEFSGTGMGLAITKKIIEKHGGKIWLSSEEGKGSIFYFTVSKQL